MSPSWQELTASERGREYGPRCHCCGERKDDVGNVTDEDGYEFCTQCFNCAVSCKDEDETP